STEACACVWPSSESTSVDLIRELRCSFFSAAFCTETASFTARSRFAPYAARSPVNGNTSPMRRLNAHVRADAARVALDVGAVLARNGVRPAARATARRPITILGFGMTPPLGPLRRGPGPVLQTPATLPDNPRACKSVVMPARAGRTDDPNAPRTA